MYYDAVWLLVVALTAASSFCVAAAVSPKRNLAEVFVLAIVIFSVAIVGVVRLLGLVDAFYFAPTLVATLVLCAGGLRWALGPVRRPAVLARVRSALTFPKRMWRDAFVEQEFLFYVTPLAALAVWTSVLIGYWFPQWAWDSLWYHIPTACYLIQEHGSRVIGAMTATIAYPRNLEEMAAWTMLLVHRKACDGLTQVPFGILGGLIIAAWSRRLGAKPALAASVGSLFLLLPSVFLQLHTTQANIADATTLLAAVYFLSGPKLEVADLYAAALSAGIYLGVKPGAVLFFALYSPFLAFRLWRLWRRGQRPLGWHVAACAAIVVALGGHTHIRNAVTFHNPFYPVAISIPILNVKLPGHGPTDIFAEGNSRLFLQSPGAIEQIWQNWMSFGYRVPSQIWSDIRPGGLGPLMPLVLAPSLLGILALFIFTLARHRRFDASLGFVPIVAVISLMITASWWGRFTLPVAAAGLVALGALLSRMRRSIRQLLAGLTAMIATYGYASTIVGYHWVPSFFASASERRAETVRLRQFTWLWKQPMVDMLDALPVGATVVSDGTEFFIGEYWGTHIQNHVVELPYQANASAYADELRKLRPTWVGVEIGSAQERVVRDVLGGRALFEPPPGNGPAHRMYAIPDAASP